MKLSIFPILSIGIAVFIVALAVGGLYVAMPNNKEAEMFRTNAALQKAEADKLAAAKRRVENTKKLVKIKSDAWQATVATNTPSTSRLTHGIDLSVNPYQLVIDSQAFRNDIQRAVNAQVRQGGVHVTSGPEVPAPVYNANAILSSYYNYPALGFPIVMFDLGQVTVQGTYEQITANVRSWSRMRNYLAVADGLSITGTSPNLTGTYNVTVIGYIRGKDIFPPIPDFDLTGGGSNNAGGGPANTGAGGGPQTGGGAAGGRSRPSLGVSGG